MIPLLFRREPDISSTLRAAASLQAISLWLPRSVDIAIVDETFPELNSPPSASHIPAHIWEVIGARFSMEWGC